MTTDLTTETTTETTVVVKADDLARILHNAYIASDHDRNALPVLAAVQLELDGSTLLAVGTDRYRLHTDTAEVAGIEDQTATARALIAGADVTSIVKLCKGAGAVTLTFVGRTLAVRTENTTATYSTAQGGGEFPKWHGLMPAADAPMDVPVIVFGINPQALAGFAAVLVSSYKGNGKTKTMTVRTTSPTKPFRVEIGDTFVGLIMPVRLPA